MIAVTFQLGAEILIGWKAWLIAVLSVVVTFGMKKAGALWIVAGGALLGYLLTWL